jgi:hypothetical protein
VDNPQYFVFNENRSLLDQPRTVICTGMGRSGTSAVMSLLDFLGLWVGDNARVRTRENKALKRALHQDLSEAAGLIAEYNAEFPIWAFKAPSLRRSLSEVIKLFRNPLVIVPHRDVVGILGRLMVSEGKPVQIDDLYRSIVGQRRMIEQLKEIDVPQLHISFPLLVGSQEEALRAISEFVGLPVPHGDLQSHMDHFHQRYLGPPGEVNPVPTVETTSS